MARRARYKIDYAPRSVSSKHNPHTVQQQSPIIKLRTTSSPRNMALCAPTAIAGASLPQASFRTLFVDDHLLIVDKDAGLLTVPGRGEGKAECLLSRVRVLPLVAAQALPRCSVLVRSVAAARCRAPVLLLRFASADLLLVSARPPDPF